MRPSGNPVLYEEFTPFCRDCVIDDCCERGTDAACATSKPCAAVIDVTEPDALGQFLSLADGPPRMEVAIDVPAFGRFTPLLPARPEALLAISQLPVASVGFKLSDYLTLVRKAAADGKDVRSKWGIGDRLIVVVGADEHSKCLSYFYGWRRSVLPLLRADPPDLLVPPDLGLYEGDKPIVRYAHAYAAQHMYRSAVLAGIATVPAFSWLMECDIKFFASWMRMNAVPGVFMDLQNWPPSTVLTLVDELRPYLALFPERCEWLINGSMVAEVWRGLRGVLGNVRVTTNRVFHEARNRKTFLYDGEGRLWSHRTDLSVTEAVIESVAAADLAATDALEAAAT